MLEIPPNVGAYFDRHGKRRWRYRARGLDVSLRGEPGTIAFEQSYSKALKGEPSGSRIGQKAELRRLAMAVHYQTSAIRRAKKRAKEKVLPFSISEKTFADLLKVQDWKCAVSGLPFATQNVDGDRSLNAFRPSIDRMIPELGYVPGNVRIVCEIVNLAMNDWGTAPLIQLVNHMATKTGLANLVGEPKMDEPQHVEK